MEEVSNNNSNSTKYLIITDDSYCSVVLDDKSKDVSKKMPTSSYINSMYIIDDEYTVKYVSRTGKVFTKNVKPGDILIKLYEEAYTTDDLEISPIIVVNCDEWVDTIKKYTSYAKEKQLKSCCEADCNCKLRA